MYIWGRDFVTFAKFRFSEFKTLVTGCCFSVTFMEVDIMAVITFLGLWGFFVTTYLVVRFSTMPDGEYILFKE